MKMYKITNDRIIHKNDGDIDIPRNLDNRHYQQFLRDVKEQGISIVEGPDVSTKSYAELRLSLIHISEPTRPEMI